MAGTKKGEICRELTEQDIVKELGVDWKDYTHYPHGSSTREQYMWELLRRNPIYWRNYQRIEPYKEYWGESAKKLKDPILDSWRCMPEARRGETKKRYKRRLRDMGNNRRIVYTNAIRYFQQKWGIIEPIDPMTRYSEKIKFVTSEPRISINNGKKRRLCRFKIIAPNEAVVVFRTDAGLMSQFKYVTKKINAKRRRDLGLTHFYLRCYDASTLGETRDSICNHFMDSLHTYPEDVINIINKKMHKTKKTKNGKNNGVKSDTGIEGDPLSRNKLADDPLDEKEMVSRSKVDSWILAGRDLIHNQKHLCLNDYL